MIKGFLPDFYRRISIKAKLMVVAIIFIVYPILIIGYFGYRNYADVMKEKAISDSQNTARELSNLLSERIEKLNLFAVQIFYDHKIYDAYNEELAGNMDSFTQNNFQQYLQSTLFSKYELSEILIHFSSYKSVFQANRTLVATTESFSQINNLHECALLGKGKPVWYISHKDGKVTGIYLAKIIYDLQDIKKEVGMIVFKVDEQYLFEVFNDFISHTKQNISLFNNDGQKIFSNQAFTMDTQEPIDMLLKSNLNTNVSEIKVKNDKVYTLYDTIQPVNWKLSIGISENVLLKEVRDIARFILLLCVATLPICIILVNYLHIDIIKPLDLLIKRMRRIEKGEMGVTIESKRMDEFGYVFNNFNKMSQNLKNLIDTVYKKQIAIKDAEIKALQAQINPHFLYNTLEAINWKAKMNGVEEISDMVSALSTIIEANLNRKNEKFIPVYREIEYISSYNFLIQKRFGKKIKFIMDVEDETLNRIIPKFIVQPIIENSIHHGLEMKKGGGAINISIKLEGDALLIVVSDDGLGMSADVLNRIRDDIIADDRYLDNGGSLGDSSKIGVLNVHRRIRLLCGENYGLDISSKEGSGTTVFIKLPAKMPEGSVMNV